jgi:hypothetical protein
MSNVGINESIVAALFLRVRKNDESNENERRTTPGHRAWTQSEDCIVRQYR